MNRCVDCSSPWTLVNGFCIQYFDNGTVLTWNEARKMCRSFGADLIDLKFDTFFQTIDILSNSVLMNLNGPSFYVKMKFFYYFILYVSNDFLLFYFEIIRSAFKYQILHFFHTNLLYSKIKYPPIQICKLKIIK